MSVCGDPVVLLHQLCVLICILRIDEIIYRIHAVMMMVYDDAVVAAIMLPRAE